MARVTSSPAAQQPKLTSHSAQASTTLVRGRTSTAFRALGIGPGRSLHRLRYGSVTGPSEAPRNCHRSRLRWDNATNRFPED